MANARDIEKLRWMAEEIDGALELLKEVGAVARPAIADGRRLGGLIEQCMDLCREAEAVEREPIRTLHHFACTGGTLISKCVAAMPNVQMFSEISPFSTIEDPAGKPKFAPTDMIRQVRQSTRGADRRLVAEMFLAAMRVTYGSALERGYRVVLRDHTHSQYCTGEAPSTAPGLREVLSPEFDVLSALTVRHPVESYLSLKRNGWDRHYTPRTYDEYCRRYLAFLDDFEGTPMFRYEDFLAAPTDTMPALCAALALPYSDQFPLLFSAIELTGDSGRRAETIEQRPPRPVPDWMEAELAATRRHDELVDRLGYATTPDASPHPED